MIKENNTLFIAEMKRTHYTAKMKKYMNTLTYMYHFTFYKVFLQP